MAVTYLEEWGVQGPDGVLTMSYADAVRTARETGMALVSRDVVIATTDWERPAP